MYSTDKIPNCLKPKKCNIYHYTKGKLGGRLIAFAEDELETLTQLGLSMLEAKVYLALAQLEESNATAIGKFSQIARPDIYRILGELEERGMVEKTLTRPLKFKAIPLQRVIHFLLEKRTKETRSLKKKTEKLLKHFSDTQNRIGNPQKGFRFFEISYMAGILKNDVEQNKLDWQTVDIVTSWGRFSRWVFVSKKDLERLLQKGIRMRIIVSSCSQAEIQQSLKKKSFKKVVDLCQNPSLHVRYISTDVPALLGINGNTQVNMSLLTEPYKCGGIGPFLCSDHSGFVGIARLYFETLWDAAREDDFKEKE